MEMCLNPHSRFYVYLSDITVFLVYHPDWVSDWINQLLMLTLKRDFNNGGDVHCRELIGCIGLKIERCPNVYSIDIGIEPCFILIFVD